MLFWQDIKKLKLEDPTTYRYLNQSHCIKLEGMDDSKEYAKTREAMGIVGISVEEQVTYFPFLLVKMGAIWVYLIDITFFSGSNISSFGSYSSSR